MVANRTDRIKILESKKHAKGFKMFKVLLLVGDNNGKEGWVAGNCIEIKAASK